MKKKPAKLIMVQGNPFVVTNDNIELGNLYVRYDIQGIPNVFQCNKVLHREKKSSLIDNFDSTTCLKVVAEPSQVGMMDKLTTFKFLWFIKYTDMAISEMDDSDIQKILDNGGDCFIELVDEFESPEMFYDKPWGSSELRISFFSDKIIIHIN
jgi:hypothetical protein